VKAGADVCPRTHLRVSRFDARADDSGESSGVGTKGQSRLRSWYSLPVTRLSKAMPAPQANALSPSPMHNRLAVSDAFEAM
jgi:hypothetical protein